MKEIICFLIASILLQACNRETLIESELTEWTRIGNPVFRDTIIGENYQVASDAHVFFEGNELKMIYTGDEDGKPSIKLAQSNTLDDWESSRTLLDSVSDSGLDSHKETGFYRKATNGKHQIFYIGYDNESTYQAQIFLAEADSLNGPYTIVGDPLIERGIIADKDVYCMTSPSVVEHQGELYMTFIGWDNSPNNVTEVWVIGATSNDGGYSWNNFQLVDTRIGMEGQVTKLNENEFVAVRTGDYEDKEAVFYSTSNHPFGPWDEMENPILVQQGIPFEKDEIIAPSIFIDPINGEEVLYYTGADYSIGWWIMMAQK